MTGHEDYNYPAFHRMAELLRKDGHEPVNPAEHFEGDQTRPYRDYMRRDLGRLVTDVDAIVLLDGWEASPGAYLEYLVAVATELRIYVQHNDSIRRLYGYLDDSPRRRLAHALNNVVAL
jgi:hypothetical protein